MRFATRTFLWSFIPFALLLAISFWSIQRRVVNTVRDELRTSIRQAHRSMARSRAQSELQNRRFLNIVAENPALKAGLQLMLQERDAAGDARRTVEDQLREISESLGFDFLLASDPNGKPLAAVLRQGKSWLPVDNFRTKPPQYGFHTIEGLTYEFTSVQVNQGDENIGMLSVGEIFDFAGFNTPAVLTKAGLILKQNLPQVAGAELERALKPCGESPECDVKIKGQLYLSLAMESDSSGTGYVLRSLQNVDAASAPVQSILRRVFLFATLGALAAALLVSAVSSKSIVKPIAEVVARLRAGSVAGVLPAFDSNGTPIQEIRELMLSFNRAAEAVRESEATLGRAYIAFIGSLASALDARDPYTAGHSRRVSEGAIAVGSTMRLAPAELETIRIGALLHDIGKIGISDSVLQKPGRLTPEEFRIIQQHPTIGRHIIEAIPAFDAYLPVIELHHENWDGTGYPKGLAGLDVPLDARIVHVVDAYDAMTSDRPYRRGMSHDEAVAVLEKFSGTQFDPEVVRVFMGLTPTGTTGNSLARLAEVVGAQSYARAAYTLIERSTA